MIIPRTERVSLHRFLYHYAFASKRRMYLSLNIAALFDFAARIDATALIIGGSLLRINVNDPNDVDCAVLVPDKNKTMAFEWYASTFDSKDMHLRICSSQDELIAAAAFFQLRNDGGDGLSFVEVELPEMHHMFLDGIGLQRFELFATRFAQLPGEHLEQSYWHTTPAFQEEFARMVLRIVGAEGRSIFLCHAKEDRETVLDLHGRLSARGHKPWIDEKNIPAGAEWETEIEIAIEKTDFFLTCLSTSAIRKMGFIQAELRYSLKQADRRPPGDIFIIPVCLSSCDLPRELVRYQAVNLFEADGFEKLCRSIEGLSYPKSAGA